MGFPTRYVTRPLNEHGKLLDPVPLRDRLTRITRRIGTDLTDGLFMASRDGRSFRRWDEAFLRPGPQAEGHWIQEGDSSRRRCRHGFGLSLFELRVRLAFMRRFATAESCRHLYS